MVRCQNDCGETAVNFDDADVWLIGLRNFAGLTAALLLVGISPTRTYYGGIVVVCRQVCMMNTFQHETSLINQHSGRTLKLLRDVVVKVGAICVVSYLLVPSLAPDIHLSCCFVESWMTSRTVYLFLLPITVNVILGVIVLARTSPPEVDADRQDVTQTTGGDFVDKAIDFLPLHGYENGFDKITHSRWNRFVIVASASVLTWFVLMVAMALEGILLQPPNAETVFVMVSVSTLYSVWSACSLFIYWT
ncbi:hypothetical protein NP493_1659g00022 [Ridgeia piscesae]|uniref:Uncharacterized protein n=1 Tax=Ridgeia piscesae TaxID=27915 RepID=A0AAD9JXY3_RIDPI|nr:hypothetical protein NP493_1659g00022 [Ridgeia piscesae]